MSEKVKSDFELLDEFDSFRQGIIEKLKELVKVKYNGRVELAGHTYIKISDGETVYSVSWDSLVIRKGVLYVDYSYCDGWDLGVDTEHIEDEVCKFSADEIFDMICDIP